VSVVAEAKIRVWEEFREAMEKDFRLASRKFWQTIRRLSKGKQGLAQAVLSRGGELLTQTEYCLLSGSGKNTLRNS